MDAKTSADFDTWLDDMAGRWLVEDGIFVVSRASEGGLTAVAEGTSHEVPAGWVVMAGHKLAD